jgi:hypothetical protein
VDLFLLLAKEMTADGVEGVRPELEVSLHDREQIELKPTVKVDRFRVTGAVSFRGEVGVFRLCLDVWRYERVGKMQQQKTKKA